MKSRALMLLTIVVFAALTVSAAFAQNPNITSFDAPGADLNPGDYNGTYPSGINFGELSRGPIKARTLSSTGSYEARGARSPPSRLPARIRPQVPTTELS